MRLLILLALWPAFARAQTIDEAFPPTIRLEQKWQYGCKVTVARAALDTSRAPVSWLAVELASDRPCRWAELSLELPAGTRVVGMEVESRGDRRWSTARPVREARFAQNMAPGAALLEWHGTSADQDRLRLLVPMPARLGFALELPPLEHVVIEGAARTDVSLRGVAARTSPAPYTYVDARTALVTSAHNIEPARPISHRWAAVPYRSDATGIRRVIRQNRARIRYCYERVAQWRGELAGTATMQLVIGGSGAVERVTAAATELPPAVTTCLEDVFRELRFDGLEGTIVVNYPLRFSTAAY